eukprot:TRINITY_DN1346_c0_g1_i19.p2 TRINITY_DN1346_c0_g1~~TRINITY_DN1346_c0_g1_i19.p2  ORF type:complete len:103 (+),score=1.46 TRINITY_DN1346_c0_g1_i19:94-402(+)
MQTLRVLIIIWAQYLTIKLKNRGIFKKHWRSIRNWVLRMQTLRKSLRWLIIIWVQYVIIRLKNRGIFNTYNNLGVIYDDKVEERRNYEKALEIYKKLEKLVY